MDKIKFRIIQKNDEQNIQEFELRVQSYLARKEAEGVDRKTNYGYLAAKDVMSLIAKDEVKIHSMLYELPQNSFDFLRRVRPNMKELNEYLDRYNNKCKAARIANNMKKWDD